MKGRSKRGSEVRYVSKDLAVLFSVHTSAKPQRAHSIGKRALLSLVCLFAVSASMQSLSIAATRTWSGSVNTAWSAAANWVEGTVPGSADDIIIPGGKTHYPVITSANTITVHSVLIQSGGRITQTGGTISVADFNQDAGGTYAQSDGTLQLTRNWLSQGTFFATGGTVQFSGDAGKAATFSSGSTQFFNIVVDAGVDPGFDSDPCTIAFAGDFTNYNTSLDIGNEVTFLVNGTGDQSISSNVTNTQRELGNLTVDKPSGVATFLSSIHLDNDLTILNGTLDLGSDNVRGRNGGTLSVSNTGTLLVGDRFPDRFSSVSLAAASTVEYYGGSQTIAGSPRPASYGNLILSGTGTKTLGGSITVATRLSMQGSATFAPGSSTLTYGSTGTLEYAGSIAQTTGPELLATMPAGCAVIINNALGVALDDRRVIDGTLNLLLGNVTTDVDTLVMGTGATVTRGSGYVQGNFRKTISTGSSTTLFEVGDANGYAPVQASFTGVTTAGGMIVKSTDGDHPNISTSFLNPTRSVNRYWTLGNSGILFTSYSATFSFTSAATDPGADPGTFIAGRYASAAWTLPSVGTRSSTNTQATGLTAFGDFQLGEASGISGTVFEDAHYGGGPGRDLATSAGVGRAGARVELYTASGSFSAATTTDAIGRYAFSLLAAGTYYIRVVNDSVSSARANYTTLCKAVQTYRTDAPAGSAVAVTDWVGGTNPAVGDAGRGSTGTSMNTSTYVFAAGNTGTAQSVARVVYDGGRVSGVDFGFSFNVIVNTNDAGQGSLRQFIINANTLGGDAALSQGGLVAGIDNAVFMISNGSAGQGLRAAHNAFSGGIASIRPTSALPTLSTAMVLDARKQPGWSGSPVVELDGTGAGSATSGLTLSGGDCVVRGFVINRFAGSASSAGIWIASTGSNIIQSNFIGTDATGAAASPNGTGIVISLASGNAIGGTGSGTANLISGNTGCGIRIPSGTGNAILANSITGNGGIGIDLGTDNVTVNNGTRDAGLPNLGMDSPVFTAAVLSGTTLTVSGYVGSTANQPAFAGARVEVFKSDNDATGYGEGPTYLGTLTADGNGNFSGSLTVAGILPGDRVTGTATDGSNNTSEFGANAQVKGVKIFSTAAGGSWNTASTWVGGVAPTADNAVDIVAGATVTLDGSISRNAGNTLAVFGTLDCRAYGVSGAGDFLLTTGATLEIGSPDGITSTGAQGNIQVSGVRTFPSTANYTFNGAAPQTSGSGLPATVNILTINTSSGSNTVTLSSPVSVDTLSMVQGTLMTGSSSVTITGDRTGSGVISGTVTRTHLFAAGVAYAFESPSSTLMFASGGVLPGSVTLTMVPLSPGANSFMDPVARYYDISQVGGSGYTYTLRLHYEDAEVVSPNSETSPPLQFWHKTAAAPDVWERHGATSRNTTANWVEATGQADAGRWALSSRTVPAMVLTMVQSDDHPFPGQTVLYTITYVNAGDGSAGTVLITASAPVHTSYVPGSVLLNGIAKTDQSGDDEVTLAGTTLTVNLGALAAGATGSITYTVTIE